MTPQETGFILLSSHLGYPDRPILTHTMMKSVQQQVAQARREFADRPMCTEDLLKMGLAPALADRVIGLMSDHAALERYLKAAEQAGCVPITPLSPLYPRLLWQRRGYEAPCCLWAKGDLSLLNKPAVAVVGSREPAPVAANFALRAGWAIAENDLVLVSGNATGVDELAQEACQEMCGSVISVVADTLCDKKPCKGMLYLSEHDFDLGFSAQRALSRNHVIHAMGELTIVCQCAEGKGGTWSGSNANLKNKWSKLVCFDDHSPGACALQQLGAQPVKAEDIKYLCQAIKKG